MIKTADASYLSESISNLLFRYDDEHPSNIHWSGGGHIMFVLCFLWDLRQKGGGVFERLIRVALFMQLSG